MFYQHFGREHLNYSVFTELGEWQIGKTKVFQDVYDCSLTYEFEFILNNIDLKVKNSGNSYKYVGRMKVNEADVITSDRNLSAIISDTFLMNMYKFKEDIENQVFYIKSDMVFENKLKEYGLFIESI